MVFAFNVNNNHLNSLFGALTRKGGGFLYAK